MNFDYINIHTHGASNEPNTLVVHNLYPCQYTTIHDYRYGTVGMHPWLLHENEIEKEFEILQKAALDPIIIAIGETGLDKACKTDFKLQQKVFEQHLLTAKNVRKPVVLHCVRSYDEILEYVREYENSIDFMFHWYYGDLYITKQLLKLTNTYFSFGHILLQLTKKTKLNLEEIPVERMFLETDDSGDSIKAIYDAASSLLNIPMLELQHIIKNNFAGVFEKQKSAN